MLWDMPLLLPAIFFRIHRIIAGAACLRRSLAPIARADLPR
jgi:hypothetical protein